MKMPRGSKEEILERVARMAGDYEELSVNCAQGTLLALQEEFRLSEGKDALKAAYFTPGIVARGETCGAVIGGLMAFGLAFGRDTLHAAELADPKANEAYFKLRRKVWRFCEEFKKEYGSGSFQHTAVYWQRTVSGKQYPT